MSYAERNRAIKKLLERSFGHGKVTVRGSRGTAYGWVSVHISYAPRDREHRQAIIDMIWKMFSAANIQIGTYGYDDPGSDYGYGSKIHLDLDACLDTFRRDELIKTCTGKSGIQW